MTMTNFQSVAGSILWAAVAGILMLATFEPVGSHHPQAPAAAHRAAL